MENGDGFEKKEGLGTRVFVFMRDFSLGINEIKFHSSFPGSSRLFPALPKKLEGYG